MSETPRLSPSIANLLLTRSPLHAWHRHRLLGGVDREPTVAMENGTLIHALLLGGKDIVPIDATDYRTKDAKELRYTIETSGRIPVLAHRLDAAKNTVEIIRRRMGISLEGGEREKRVEWESDGVVCSGFIDAVSDGTIVEIKTIDDAGPYSCRKSAENYGYHVQGAAYLEAMKAIDGRDRRVVFYFCESEPPNDVTPFELSGSLLELGQRRWNRAKRIWKECLASGVWPGASGGKVASLPASDWALSREEDES